jgi:sugar-specific transcriptional regulator TrmB
MPFEAELRDLDFTDNEIKVYIVLLRIGSAKAGRIAKESALERTSTYNALKRLVEKGMVSSIFEANRKVFSASEPSKIVDIFKEKEERASLVIPKLEELKKFEKEKENILKFRGYSGVKTVLNDVLSVCKDGDEYMIMGSEGQLSERMPLFAKIFVARKDKRKLMSRILVRKGNKQTVSSKYTKVRFVPQEVISPAVTTIYGSKVHIILWSEIPEAIIIDDADVAKTYRSYFEFMWKNAEKN